MEKSKFIETQIGSILKRGDADVADKDLSRQAGISSATYCYSGHYSQLVWRKTTHVGCGRATCGSKAVVVCRYDPPGNHIGRAPY